MSTATTLEAVTSDERAAALLAVEGEMARIVRAVRITLLETAARFSPEIQPSGYLVLRQIVAHHPTPPGAIIASVGMDKSAVSRQLRILKDLGFVTSVPDPDDRRASLYAPTAETVERMGSIRRDVQAAYADILDDWSENDLEQFVRLLGAFNDGIERR
ncbi:MarR family winged helix-turn-helix transcriptional regulator [Herbiconiux sp. CPCC 205763]|uniref:MarR family winged helix-turn-helix transcriptional regulator n=1 Tax=Herbiconiux aconitum TaxID=2970913 RepID=A0ABT2GRZ2_9MICO|nr:MarR family winged helix-turn-helix transcriptional regulator [Herbiconiux aconitum]MCS5718989.1 MarR family winged helix-turn-helix transcriptional regulator [Herbiconiux aconitum]